MMIGQFRMARKWARPLLVALFLLLPAMAAAKDVDPGGSGSSSGAKLISNPAEKFAISPGGVDMRTGQYAYSETDLAIGGLALTRTMQTGVLGNTSPFGNFSHNFDIMITERRINLFEHNYETGPDFRIRVHFGGRSETFDARQNDSGYAQTSKAAYSKLTFSGTDKASASTVYTFEAADGTIATFRQIGSGDCSTILRCAYVSEIVEPDGTRLSFEYDPAHHLRSVVSSRGYALLLRYAGAHVDKACVLNLAVIAKPTDNACPESGTQGTASYTYVVFQGKTRLASVTDPGGAVSQFTYSQGSGSIQMGFIKPGHQAPWLTNSIFNGSDMEGGTFEVTGFQSIPGYETFAEAQTWSYIFDYPPPVEGQIPSIAGGDFTNAAGETTQVKFGFPPVPGTSPGECQNCPGGVNVGGIVYQQTSGPARIVDPLERTATFNYCDPVAEAGFPPTYIQNRCIVFPLQSFKDPGGIETILEYDAWRNIKRVTRKANPLLLLSEGTPAQIITSATFDCGNPKYCAKPQTVTDANLNVTTYTYRPEHGGIWRETGPPVPTRQIGGPDAGQIVNVSPQKRYFYAQRSAWVKNGSGGYQAGSPIWLLTGESYCRTSPALADDAGCSVPGDEVVTAYAYGPDSGPNTLMLRGVAVAADGITLRTCYAYDERGNKISETAPAGNVGLTACPGAPPTAAAAHTTSWRYDAEGRQTGIISPDPDGAGPLRHPAVRNTWTDAGELKTVEHGDLAAWQSESVAPASWTGFTRHRRVDYVYDLSGRKVTEVATATGAVRSTTHYKYDNAGRLVCVARRMDENDFFGELDPCLDRQVPGAYGPDRITRNVYDAAGQLVQVREAVGTPDESTTTYAYTANGQRSVVIDGRGNRAELRHDGQDRLMERVFPTLAAPAQPFDDSSPASALATAGLVNGADREVYGYDPAGNRRWLTKRDGSKLTFTYDALNRMTLKIVPQRPDPLPALDASQIRDVFYAYDLRGLQTEADFDSLEGEGVTNAFDGFGRLSSSTIAMGGYTRAITYGHDENGNRTALTFGGQSFSFVYDKLNRMTDVRLGLTGSGGSLAAIGYNVRGERSSLVRGASDNTAYTYDGMGRLASLTDAFVGGTGNNVSTFAYNPASQVVRSTRSNHGYAWSGHYNVDRPYAANRLNQYQAAGSFAFLYDANGNLVRNAEGTRIVDYVYDVENRLVRATGSSTANLVYDPLGRLFQLSGGSAGPTQFLYDGDELVAEYDGVTGAMTQRYVHGAGVDDPLVWFEGAGLGIPRFLHTDHQGSITGIATGAGQILNINSYDEYGIPAGTNHGRFAYTGQIWLDELEMYHYRARIYSPTLGRFLQTDPVGYDDQINLYAYVGNDPINRVDPNGLRATARSAQEGAATAARINRYSKSQYAFDENNVMYKTGEYKGKGRRSSTYSEQIDKVISHSDTVEFRQAQKINVQGRERDVDRAYSGGATFTEERPMLIVVSGHGNNLRAEYSDGSTYSSAEDINLHEVVTEALPALAGDESTLKAENQIRRELGKPERKPDDEHPN